MFLRSACRFKLLVSRDENLYLSRSSNLRLGPWLPTVKRGRELVSFKRLVIPQQNGFERQLGCVFNCSVRNMGAESSKQMDRKNAGKGAEDFIEGVVCHKDDLEENQMKAFDLENTGKVLIVQQKGKIYALGNKCTHYGAPLENGALGDGRVRCPWHGACFNISTGDIEDFPGLDSLPCFQVKVESDGAVKVRASKSQLATSRAQKCIATLNMKESTTFLVIGGGPAAQVCAETLRQGGFKGHIIMVAKEPVLPYDRIKLSKALSSTAESLALRSADFYENNNIELKLGVELINLDTENKVAHLSSNDQVQYDSVFLATGSSARQLTESGSSLKNVFVLRDIQQANEISSQIGTDKNKNIVIVGASFIGMECAAYCNGKVKSVTVVGRGSAPLSAVLGPEIGKRLMDWFQEKGVHFQMNVDVKELQPSESDSTCVGQVCLSNNQTLPADIVIAGIGSVPNTNFLKNSSIKMHGNGTIPVNEFLATNICGIYAGGDIAHAPVLGTVASIGHWQLAHYHGRIAARNMLGKNEPLKTVPFFWTMLFNKSIRYAGYAPNFDDIILHGDLEDIKFIAYYCKGDEVQAVATCGKDPTAAQFAELLAQGRKLSKDQVKQDATKWFA